MKKPGFNNIDNVVVKRIKDSVLSDGEILVSGGAFEGNIDPLVENRIVEIDSELAQKASKSDIIQTVEVNDVTKIPSSAVTFGINTKFVKTLVILLILWYNRNVVGYWKEI